MRPVIKIGVLLGLFVAVAGIAGYVTLRSIVKSDDLVIVPDLGGKDIVYTLKLLTDLGLNTKVSGFEYRADIPENHVAFQDPRPGAEVKKDRDIRIIVSKGPQTLIIPDLAGMDIREVNIILENNGLSRGRMSEIYSDGAVRGAVVSQVPAPGRIVNRGDSIDLLVSLGTRPVRYKMPYLNGLSSEEAILILERSQLTLGQIRRIEREDLPKAVVVGQDPRAGYPVVSGSLVNLVVNREENVVFHDKGLFLFHYRVGPGFLKKHLRLRINAFGLLYDLLDAFWPPGEDVWMLLPQQDEPTFFLYEGDDLVLSHSFGSQAKYPTLREVEIGEL